MKIFITGASGFIGNNLARKLAEENHDITVLVRNTADNKELTDRGIKVINGDIFNIEKMQEGMDGCDRVFHLAAYAKPSSYEKELPYKTNVQGTINVLNAAKDRKIKRVIVTSTAGTAGFSRDGSPVDERTIAGPYFTEYERTKAIAEKIALESSSREMDVIVVQPSRVYGPGKLTKSNSVTRIIRDYNRGLWRIIPGDGNAIGNYVFINDVVRGHILASESGTGGEKYLLGGENLSYLSFFDHLGRACGRRRKLFKIEKSYLKKIVRVSGFVTDIAGKPPFLTENWIDKYLQNWIVSSNKAVNELSYKITPFEKGADETVKWLNSRT